MNKQDIWGHYCKLDKESAISFRLNNPDIFRLVDEWIVTKDNVFVYNGSYRYIFNNFEGWKVLEDRNPLLLCQEDIRSVLKDEAVDKLLFGYYLKLCGISESVYASGNYYFVKGNFYVDGLCVMCNGVWDIRGNFDINSNDNVEEISINEFLEIEHCVSEIRQVMIKLLSRRAKE